MKVEIGPIEISTLDPGEAIEKIRELAHPRLIITIEGEGPLEIIQRVNEINDSLGSITYANEMLPMPDLTCPTCGTKL